MGLLKWIKEVLINLFRASLFFRVFFGPFYVTITYI
jgi:hypothetical protein